MATTVGEIIRSSMRKIGVLAAGEPLPADEGDDALSVLRQMVDAWSLESLLVPVVSVITHPLVAGQSQYTIGIKPDPLPVPLPANHIQTARPEQILAAFIRDSGGTDYKLNFIDVGSYSDISVKYTEARPAQMFIRRGWPENTINFDTRPYEGDTLHMEAIQPLSESLPAIGLTESVSLPPGYERALIYNLCLELADEWGRPLTATIALTARDSKRKIKRSNFQAPKLRVDRALLNNGRGTGTYDINAGP